MKGIHEVVFATVLVTALVLATSVGAVDVQKHSGIITAIANDARTFMLTEVGPWQVRDGATVVTHRTITLAPETQFAVVVRAPEPPSGYPTDFVEFPIGPERVFLNDFVTVECRGQTSGSAEDRRGRGAAAGRSPVIVKRAGKAQGAARGGRCASA